jgi:hypothetical protein
MSVNSNPGTPESDDVEQVETRLIVALRRRPMNADANARILHAIHAAEAQVPQPAPIRLRDRLLRACAMIALTALIGYCFRFGIPAEKPPMTRVHAGDEEPPAAKNPDPEVVEVVSIKTLVNEARTHVNKLFNLFPEKQFSDENVTVGSDAECCQRVLSLCNDMVQNGAVLKLDEAAQSIAITGAKSQVDEVKRFVAALALQKPDKDGEVILTELRIFELRQIPKVLKDMKLEAGQTVLLKNDDVQSIRRDIITHTSDSTLTASRLTMYAAQSGRTEVGCRASYVKDYAIDGDGYEPVIGTYFRGCRFFARAWPRSSGDIAVRACFMNHKFMGLATRTVNGFVINNGKKTDKLNLSLPIQFPDVKVSSWVISAQVPPGQIAATLYGVPGGKNCEVSYLLLLIVPTPLSREAFEDFQRKEAFETMPQPDSAQPAESKDK